MILTWGVLFRLNIPRCYYGQSTKEWKQQRDVAFCLLDTVWCRWFMLHFRLYRLDMWHGHIIYGLSMPHIGCPWFTNTGVFTDTHFTQQAQQAMYF